MTLETRVENAERVVGRRNYWRYDVHPGLEEEDPEHWKESEFGEAPTAELGASGPRRVLRLQPLDQQHDGRPPASVRFDPLNPHPRRQLKPGVLRSILGAFLSLRTAYDATILDFAMEYGALPMCKHGSVRGDVRAGYVDRCTCWPEPVHGPLWERRELQRGVPGAGMPISLTQPICAYRNLADWCHGVLTLSDLLRRRPATPKNGTRPVISRRDFLRAGGSLTAWHNMPPIQEPVGESRRKMPVLQVRMLLDSMLDQLRISGGIEPASLWAVDGSRHIVLRGAADLWGAIAVELWYVSISGHQGPHLHEICSFCRLEFPASRRRNAKAWQRVCCGNLRCKQDRNRDAQRRRREVQRAAQPRARA